VASLAISNWFRWFLRPQPVQTCEVEALFATRFLLPFPAKLAAWSRPLIFPRVVQDSKKKELAPRRTRAASRKKTACRCARAATRIPSACGIVNIALNDAMILSYDANLGRMEFSERTAADFSL
jgi:hypothetical protein